MVDLIRGYEGGEEIPLAGYAAILGAYGGLVAAYLARTRGRALPDRAGLAEVALFGVATHKLTRTITKDWVTAPLRAPFTRYAGAARTGEVRERSRGRGLRRALGDLLTCAVCTGPWVATALYALDGVAPRYARSVSRIFASVAVSDFLHGLYEATLAEARAIDQHRSAPSAAALPETPRDPGERSGSPRHTCRDAMSRDIISVGADETALAAAQVMGRGEIGFLPVVGADGSVVGVVTDRDIVVRLMADDLKPTERRVDEVMTREVVTCNVDEDLRAAHRKMRHAGVSRLLVEEDSRVVGIISLSDLAEIDSGAHAARTLHMVSEHHIEAPRQ